MLELILPCPHCQTSLLVDEQNAGTDVLCPGCQSHLTLPRDLSGATPPELKRPDLAAARKNHPLHRTGHLATLPEEAGAAAAQAPHHTHLPERRGLSAEEEMRRMAVLTAEPASFDLHNVDTRGRTAFPCPACHRPVWISSAEGGRALVCEGCSSQIIAPDPATGAPAQVQPAEGVEPRQRTVLPSRRQVEDMGATDPQAAGRPKRQGGQLPAAREATPAPAAHAADRMRSKAGPLEPIPARGDVEISSQVRKGPPARRSLTPAQEQNAAAAEFESTLSTAAPAEAPAGKLIQRLPGERLPNFSPKHEADLSAETTGNWGGGAAQENSVAFRRTLTIAIITLLLGGIGLTAYFIRSYWSPAHNPQSNQPAEENPVLNAEWARETIQRFFKAATLEEMAKEVRHPEKTLPRMKAHYTQGVSPQKMELTDDWREQDNYNNSGANFIFTFVKLDGQKSVPIALEIFNDGRLPKLDWEHYIAWSETPWSDFVRTTSERPGEFRVEVTPVDYYNGFYSDRQRYLAFRVSDRGDFGYCWAYCESGSNLAKLLLKAVREARDGGQIDSKTGEGIAQVILRLRFLPEGKQFNQASIDALIWNEWLEP